MVYEDPAVFVRLDSPLLTQERKGVDYSHPADLSVDDIAILLRSLKVEKEVSLLSYYVLRHNPTPEPVFSEDDITLLAPHLKAAWAKAESQETVVFFVNRSRKDRVPLITSGGMFLRGDQLVFVLGNFHTPMPSEPRRARVREHPMISVGEPDFRFVAGPAQTILTKKSQANVSLPRKVPTLLIQYQSLLVGAHPNPEPIPAELSPHLHSPPSSLEEKLRQLKSWREEGLIGEKEYEQKRREILKSY